MNSLNDLSENRSGGESEKDFYLIAVVSHGESYPLVGYKLEVVDNAYTGSGEFPILRRRKFAG